MTCVLPTTPWHHFNDHIPWLPMNSDSSSSLGALEKGSSQRYVSPGSDTRKSSTSSTKKRASRAGTRSVTTLSAAQLERKRANDREAQRAIRQRTKDHIDHLERTVNELRGNQEQTEKIAHATQQRNRELEEEIVYLRNKLNEAGFNMNGIPSEGQRLPESSLLSVPSASPVNAAGASIPRPGSTSTSNNSVTTQGSGSRHGSWQHGAGFVANGMGLPTASSVANAPTLTAWRSHESAQSLQPLQTSGSSLQDPMQAPGSATFQHGERVDWSAAPSSYQYISQEQQRPSQYETAPSQQPGYQSSTYHTQMTPQSEFPNISVSSSPSSYQGQTAFPAQQAFQVAPMQVPTTGPDYSSPHTQMHPPPLPNASFHTATSEQPYPQQQTYREEAAGRSYPLAHYPTA
ncbi:hypothetical protein CKM354_000555400 [Cercospora kikuchii]|uniref:BZIP domain-containing protein n=1 Tax=Cercospora kikuchii TaxID=84275 RepID=A0A9P3CDJ5_9PEZI|nr:uncharacterized protein CKM354_000555400 [Cercospora kikuchii]GIZ42279.1 hypothetical protein CKM354_000555400 [Cercospora kikuchii]